MYGRWGRPDYHTLIHELKMRNKSFDNITKLVEKSLHLRSREFFPPTCTLEFEDPKTAVLFALNFENYFPVNDELGRITYDLSYVCGLNHLAEHTDHLKNRRIVHLVDADAPFLRAPPGVPWGLKQERAIIENHIRQITASAVEKGTSPEELIVCYTNGLGGEDLYGALATFSLRKQGYIVFPESILGALFVDLAGVPDLIAVKLGAFQEKLIEEGIIEHGGVIPELEMLEIFGKCAREGKVEEEKAIVVEVESKKRSASGGRKQLDAYLSTGHFDAGVLVCPGRAGDEKYYPEYGYITWDDENKEISYLPEESRRKEEKFSELLAAAKKLISLALLKNWTTEKLLKVYGDKSIVDIIKAFMKTPKFIG